MAKERDRRPPPTGDVPSTTPTPAQPEPVAGHAQTPARRDQEARVSRGLRQARAERESGENHANSAHSRAAPTPPRKSGWINLAIDFGPVLVFFVAYRLLHPGGDAVLAEVVAVTKSTVAFVVATLAALVVSKWRLGRISPMLWLTTILVVGFGALTVVSQDAFWIRHKPTAVYLLFAAMLLIGWRRGKPTLRMLLESAFEGLDEHGWMLLTRNWGFFFVFLAALNEVFANPAWFSFDAWLKAKLMLFLPLSFLFTFVHVPMLMRHGLADDAKDEVIADTPHD